MIPKEELRGWAEGYGIRLSEEMLEQLDLYARLLVEWNEKINLTAIVDPWDIACKHFLDSLLVLHACEIPQGANIIDVGTGAGFPSVPMKIARPDLKLTLLDSLNKRLHFLQDLSDDLGQNNKLVHTRAEDAGHSPMLRERFDLVTARAVAAMPVLAEYCLPLARVGGCFAALKGPSCGEELALAQTAIGLLGGAPAEVKEYTLPDSSVRCIAVIQKKSHTPTKFPRNGGQIKKSPL